MIQQDELTVELVKEVLDFDCDTGIFRWKTDRGGYARAGETAGTPDRKGYIRLMVYGRVYAAHRLAWFVSHERWPSDCIDHINGEKNDNRIQNLRECTNAENGQNRHAARRDSKSKLLGAHPHGDKWEARITVGGKRQHLGLFNTPEEAHATYIRAKSRLHPFGEIARVNLALSSRRPMGDWA